MTCDRLERDDLLGHLGEEMDPHLEQCHVCRATAYGYARLAAALARESPRPLPAGWKERTLARIQAARAARRRRHAASLGLSLAGAAALVLLVMPRIRDPGHPHAESGALVLRLERGQGRRGVASETRAHPGDRLRASAPGLAQHVELRVYRESAEIIVRCPGARAPICQRRGDAIELSWTLAKVGTYRAVWLTSSLPLPQPTGDLDADVLAAERAGARVTESDPIDVD
jgi:hypothetical protein